MKISSGSEVVSYQYMDIMQEILTFKKKKKKPTKNTTQQNTQNHCSHFLLLGVGGFRLVYNGKLNTVFKTLNFSTELNHTRYKLKFQPAYTF